MRLSRKIMSSICWMMEASMADVVNLKRFKKRNEREQSAKQADANRARFGRTKRASILYGPPGHAYVAPRPIANLTGQPAQ